MKLPRLATILLCATVLGASPLAQKEPAKKKQEKPKTERKTEKESEEWQEIVDKKRKEIRERIRDARKRMRRGEYVQSHVRVRVKLRNGERLEGVVKNGRFVERPAGLEFVRSEMKVKGAGLRIFFYNGTSGYIFIPYRSIETYRVLKRLTELEVKSIHASMKEKEAAARAYAEKRRKEIAARAGARKLKKAKKEQLTEEQKLAAEKAKVAAEHKRLLALVEEFPPSEGWNAEKIAELKRRAIIINVYPNEKERRFMDVFDDWKKGVELQKLAKETAADEPQPMDEPVEPGDPKAEPDAPKAEPDIPKAEPDAPKAEPAPSEPGKGPEPWPNPKR